jgi:hypothetical protein
VHVLADRACRVAQRSGDRVANRLRGCSSSTLTHQQTYFAGITPHPPPSERMRKKQSRIGAGKHACIGGWVWIGLHVKVCTSFDSLLDFNASQLIMAISYLQPKPLPIKR